MSERTDVGPLDPDMSDYENTVIPTTVIGEHSSGSGLAVNNVQAQAFGNRNIVRDGTFRIEPLPDESHIVVAVNAEVDEGLADGRYTADLQAGATRATLVHRLLEKAIAEHRAAKAIAEQKAAAAAVPATKPISPTSLGVPAEADESAASLSYWVDYPEPVSPEADQAVRDLEQLETQVDNAIRAKKSQSSSPPVSSKPVMLERVAGVRQVVEARTSKRAGAESIAEAFASLKIPNLGLEPAKPNRAKVTWEGQEYQWKYHWGLQVGDEMVVLVTDTRKKPIKKGVVEWLVSRPISTRATLQVAQTKEELDSQEAIELVLPSLVFNFGCFSFVQFLLAE